MILATQAPTDFFGQNGMSGTHNHSHSDSSIFKATCYERPEQPDNHFPAWLTRARGLWFESLNKAIRLSKRGSNGILHVRKTSLFIVLLVSEVGFKSCIDKLRFYITT